MRLCKGLIVQGTRRVGSIKILNEVERKDMLGCGVTESLNSNRVEWKTMTHEGDPT